MKNPITRKRAKKRLFVRRTKHFSKASMLAVFRLALFTLMFLLLAFCVAWIVFLRMFNAQQLSERITYQLQKQFNRPVKISSINMKFLNMVELKGFYILDTVGEPGRPLVAADSVTLAFDILPLLEKELVINEVTLNAPRFNLVRTKEGVYNIADIRFSRQTKNKLPATNEPNKKLEVTIKDWRIKDGVLSFKDLETGYSHALYGLNARFENLRLNELSNFEMNMVLRNQWQERISELEIDAVGQINFADFDWHKFTLRDMQTKIFLFQQPIEMELNVENLVDPSFSLTANTPFFDAQDVSIFGTEKIAFSVPAGHLSAQGKFTEDYGKLELTKAQVRLEDVVLNAKGTADFIQQPFAMQVDFSTPLFTLPGKENYWPKLKEYKLKGKGSVGGTLARNKGKITLPLLMVQAQNVSGNFYGFKTENVSGNFQAKNNFADLYTRTTGGKIKVDRSTFDKLQLSGSWRKGNLYANIAASELNGVPLKLNVSVNNLKRNDRVIRTNLYFKTFDPMAFIETVKDFVTVITPLTGGGNATPGVTGELAWLRNFRDRLPNFMPNLAGTLSADAFSSTVLSGNEFRGEFNLTGLQAGAKKLSGPLKVRLQNGVIHQMEKLAAEQEALNVTFQPFIMMHRMERAGSFSVGRVLKDVEVTELGTAVNFTNGNMAIDNAYTVGPTISAAVSGATDWVKEVFDLTIYTMFTNTSKSGVLAENLTDESGNPALAFRVSSSMKKPKLEMLRAKKAGKIIKVAQQKGVGTDFSAATTFIQGEHHATK